MLKETPLIEEHRLCGAKFIDFHGWKLPLEFSGPTKEHLNVRKHSGLFDISHIGEIRVKGTGALQLLKKCLTNNVADLKRNQTQYNLLCNEKGGIVDDIILYCLKPGEDYLLCVNSSRREEDLYRLNRCRSSHSVAVLDESDQWAQLALQGPSADSLLTAVLNKAKSTNITENMETMQVDPAFSGVESVSSQNNPSDEKNGECERDTESSDRMNIKKNYFQWYSFLNKPILVSATGYTGEKGFEILISPEKSVSLWREILKVGKDHYCQPVGLAARDTLRMEMKYPLYGTDLNESIDPYSAGLSWVVKNPDDFVGSSALSQIKNRIKKKWVGFELSADSGVPRQGHRIRVGGKVVGQVTSGARSPCLAKMIGLGYVSLEYSSPAQRIQVEIHGNLIPAEIVATPFIKK